MDISVLLSEFTVLPLGAQCFPFSLFRIAYLMFCNDPYPLALCGQCVHVKMLWPLTLVPSNITDVREGIYGPACHEVAGSIPGTSTILNVY